MSPQTSTTTTTKIDHKTRRIETRVSRQLVMKDGKIIADSGPQVRTRIKEDNKIEESEKKETPHCGVEEDDVVGEKKELHKVTREVREENMQYHDENLKELSGQDVHQKALTSPNDLITIKTTNNESSSDDDEQNVNENRLAQKKGKMVHYSSKGKKYQDTDEILEISKIAPDGSIQKETKRTRKHEEFSDDEQPDEDNEAEALREKPFVERTVRRKKDFVDDLSDTDVE